MERIDFNNKDFKGFTDNERILLDTGILLALANQYDTWHQTVKRLFEEFIFNKPDEDYLLYITPLILNEITHLAGKPFESYIKNHGELNLSAIDPEVVVKETVEDIKKLIENKVLLAVDGDQNSLLKQLDLFNLLGSADAVNVSTANKHNLNFLTLDIKLSKKIIQNKDKITGISKIYYTASANRTY